MTTDKEKAINLLNQLIERAQQEDTEYKARMIAQHKANKATGQSFMVFHLGILRDLVFALQDPMPVCSCSERGTYDTKIA